MQRMNSPESRLVLQTFQKTLNGLVYSKSGAVAKAARELSQTTLDDRVKLNVDVESSEDSPLVDFQLVSIPDTYHLSYMGVLGVNLRSFLAHQRTSPERITAEIARSIFVVNQFYHGGYERRLRTVYEESYSFQKLWLMHDAVDFESLKDILYTSNTDQALRALGERRSLVDTGFDDWQRAIDELMSISEDDEQRVMNNVRDNRNHFVSVREAYSYALYDEMSPELRSALEYIISDNRAQAMALTLVRINNHEMLKDIGI